VRKQEKSRISTRPSRRRLRQTLSLWAVCGLVSTLILVPISPCRAANAAESTDAAESAAVDLSSFEGRWRRVEVSESDAARESAIEKAIKGLSWIVRKMASGVLRKSTAPPPELQFAWDGEQLHQVIVDKNGEFSRLVELGGDLRILKDHRGVDFSSAWTWTDQGLRLRWEQHQAIGNNVYRLDDDARSLIVRHTIIVTAISNVEPIVFLSRFDRTNLPARPAAELDEIARAASD
jgi:hypothetical protein